MLDEQVKVKSKNENKSHKLSKVRFEIRQNRQEDEKEDMKETEPDVKDLQILQTHEIPQDSEMKNSVVLKLNHSVGAVFGFKFKIRGKFITTKNLESDFTEWKNYETRWFSLHV